MSSLWWLVQRPSYAATTIFSCSTPGEVFAFCVCTLSLAERLRAHEQQKVRLSEQEAKLRTAERTARTRQLIEAGGLADKVGMLGRDANAFYGAPLSLRDVARDKKQVEQWAALRRRAFACEARQRDEGKEPIVLTFEADLDRDATTALRGGGFQSNNVLQHWTGLTLHGAAKKLAKAHGGSVRRIATNSLPSPAREPQRAAE